jgi:hypothetical protein
MRRDALLMFITSTALGGCAKSWRASLCAVWRIFPGMDVMRPHFWSDRRPRHLRRCSVLPFQLIVCSSVGLVIATLTWLIWFPSRSSPVLLLSHIC